MTDLHTIPSPVQPAKAESRRPNVLRIVAVCIIALAIFTMGGISALLSQQLPSLYEERRAAQTAYSDWPAAGTKPAFPGETLFKAQGIVALTCRNGKAHVDQNMVVGSSLRGGVEPGWFLAMYVDYDQTRNQGFCEVRFAPYHEGTKVYQLSHREGQDGWSMTTGIAFDGLDSVSARTGTKDIAVLLISVEDPHIKPGVEIKLGNNGLPAPSRDLLS